MGKTVQFKARYMVGFLAGLACAWTAALAADSVLVTAVKGQVTRAVDTRQQPLLPFIKLKSGDSLKLENGAQVQLVFVDAQRQETWQGKGRLQIGNNEANSTELPAPQVKVLPPILVKQIARMPTSESQGAAGAIRTRSMPTTDNLAEIDQTYLQLKQTAASDDTNPELYLLSSLFELKEFDRIDETLNRLQKKRSSEPQILSLVEHYRRAVSNARAVKGR